MNPSEVHLLPFLKQSQEKQQSGVIVKTRTPDEVPEISEDSGIEACAQEIIDAIHARDSKRLASALKDAFQIVDSEPQVEDGEHIEPHSFDAQNQKAVR